MAKAYQPKSTSSKLVEGLMAGLAGGLVAIVISMLLDAILRGGNLFYTVSRLGAVLTGDQSPAPTGSVGLGTPFLMGALLLLVLFTMFGIGFISYLPIVYRLNIPKALFGAIYGLFIWLLVFLLMLGFVNRPVADSINIWYLLVSCVLAGAAIGLTLDATRSRKGDS